MSDEPHNTALTPAGATLPATAKQRNRQVADHLRQASRKLAMESGTRRGIYRVLGIRPRRRDLFFRILYILLFLLCFVLPFGAGVTYFTFYVTPQYEAETRFVLRSRLPVLPNSNTPGEANIASLKVVQDTLVIASFLNSPALVQRLEEEIGLDTLFSSPEIDPLSRLQPGQSIEDKSAYFRDFIDTHVSTSSGIVTTTARAFSPQDAHTLLEAIVVLAEERVNLLNSEIWSSVLEVSQDSFDNASAQLRDVRARYAALQNETGVFNVQLEAEAFSEVVTQLRAELIDLRNNRATLLREVPETHINVVRLDQSIAVREAQLRDIEAEVASTQSEQNTLSNNQQRFEALEVEIEIAQDRFKAAAAQLEEAKLLNSIETLHLDRFIQPTVPQDQVYPVYAFEITKLLVICLSIWGVMVLGVSMLQRQID